MANEYNNLNDSVEKPVVLNYWAGHHNFGDELSPYLISKISKRNVVYADRNIFGKLVGVGSIINHENAYSNSYIWGSGLLTRKSIKRRFWPIRHRFSKSKVLATRGPLTSGVLQERGFKVASVYGDPALLMPLYYTPKINGEKNRVGLILHQRHTEWINAAMLAENGVKLISIYRSGNAQIESFIDEVASCEKIYSTSLHGIIIAQAYGVPCQWISLEGAPIHADEEFKFMDYFLGANQEVQQKMQLNSLSSENIAMMKKHRPFAAKKFMGEQLLLDTFPHDRV